MDINSILKSIGYVGIFLSVFMESGVFIALVLPLPGFSLLLTAGVFAASGGLSLPGVIATGVAAAILGYVFGYVTGRKFGSKLFSPNNARYFTPTHARKTEIFMEKYGLITLVVGRYLPFMHTAAPILSGFAKTPFGKFMLVNVIGGILWVLSAVLLGYYAGHAIPNAHYYVIPFVIGLLMFSGTKTFRRGLQKLGEKLDA